MAVLLPTLETRNAKDALAAGRVLFCQFSFVLQSESAPLPVQFTAQTGVLVTAARMAMPHSGERATKLRPPLILLVFSSFIVFLPVCFCQIP